MIGKIFQSPIIMIGLLFSFSACATENNVHFSGVLVYEPCVVPDSDREIVLDFASIATKYLYEYYHTPEKMFQIHLEECDLSIGSQVNVTFVGTEDTQLPGILALDEGSTAQGVGIGINTADGSPLQLGKSSMWLPLSKGSTVLTFNAFVQAEPNAISGKKIVPGNMTATSTFILDYQ